MSMPPFNKFTTRARDAIKRSHELALERGDHYVSTFHLLAALITQDNSPVLSILERCGVNLTELTDQTMEEIETDFTMGNVMEDFQMFLTEDLAKVIESSLAIAAGAKEPYVSVEHLFLSLLANVCEARDFLQKFSINHETVTQALITLQADQKNNPEAIPPFRILSKYSRNLTELASMDKLDPVIGRDREIMRVIEILARRTKNNPILIGEPGTGKTAIAEGLAIRMAKNDVPESLRGKDLFLLDMGLLVAGTKYRGEFEERLKGIMKELVVSAGRAVLFIDEIHTLIGAGGGEGSMDAANILKPALARGEIRAIGATTINEYQKYFEKDPALARRFQPIYVNEPSTEDTIAILRGLRSKYELFHGVHITEEAILAAVNLSTRYITNRFLPDKAVDLIDEAAAGLKISLENKPPELDTAHRTITRLEIEREGLQHDTNHDEYRETAIKRDKEIEREIADVREHTSDLEMRWNTEREILGEIKKIQSEIVTLRHEADTAEQNADLGTVAEIRYGKIPACEKNLVTLRTRLKKIKSSHRLLREEINAEDIARVVAKWTNIPVARMLSGETEKLIHMEAELKKRVKGQDNAIEKISHAIRRSRVGVSDPRRPIGSFMFLGPTGVGKTELTKALTQFMFDDESAMIRVDMSEFMEKHSVSKLIGAAPGYVGYEESGKFIESVRHKPYSVILFDEVEKAHPDVFNILLQVLDDGRLTDGKGRVVNFKNTIIIMTSNIGSQHIQKMQSIGFTDKDASADYLVTKDRVMDSLREFFRPEFLNRIDEIIVFDTISRDQIRDIVRVRVQDIFQRIADKGINMNVTEPVYDYLAERGYDPQFGARPLNRLIQTDILNHVATLILGSHVGSGDTLVIDIKKGNLVFDVKKKKTRSPVKVEDLFAEKKV